MRCVRSWCKVLVESCDKCVLFCNLVVCFFYPLFVVIVDKL